MSHVHLSVEEVATHSCLEVEVYIDGNSDQIIGILQAILGQQLWTSLNPLIKSYFILNHIIKLHYETVNHPLQGWKRMFNKFGHGFHFLWP
jgi:hypothetical protein